MAWIVDGATWASGVELEDACGLQYGVAPHFPVESFPGAAPEQAVFRIFKEAFFASG